MAKADPFLVEALSSLSKKELESVVLKAVARHPPFKDFLMVNYLDKSYGNQDFFEKVSGEIDALMMKRYQGRAEQLRMAAMLAACNKKITEFAKINKQPEFECRLLIKVLDKPFSMPASFFQTCFTSINSRTALMLKRLITLYNNKLYEDIKLEYRQKINDYLRQLHGHSNFLDTVLMMPQKVD